MGASKRELKTLVEACLYLQESASWVKGKYRHEVPNSVWSAWCKQLKYVKNKLDALDET